MNIRQIIGDNVRCHRHKIEWSQEKLGKESGLHHDYIGRLERGLENIGVENLVKIAEVFNIEPQNLLIENHCFSELKKSDGIKLDGIKSNGIKVDGIKLDGLKDGHKTKIPKKS